MAFALWLTGLPASGKSTITALDMGTNLHVYIAKTLGPIGKQMTGQPLVAEAEPFRGDHDLFWAALV